MMGIDVQRFLACLVRMARPSAPTHITARLTIEGPAEEILREAQKLRGGKRSVSLSVVVSRQHYSDPHHFIPEIKEGKFQAALEKLEMLRRQTIIDAETDRRLDTLIRDFGSVTE